MNGADLVIIILALITFVRGLETGFLRQAGYFFGLLGGLYLGSLLAPQLTDLVATNEMGRFFITITTVLVTAACLAGLGETAGWQLRKVVHGVALTPIDNGAGAILGGASVIVMAWLLAGVTHNMTLGGIGPALNDSKIIAAADGVLPPAPAVIARLEHIVSPNGFPRVFTGVEPAIDPVDPPSSALVAQIQDKAAASTVKIQGYGCGGVVTGSGFVADNGLVITNAHVVAGIRNPVIIDRGGQRAARTIWFNSNLDTAVLAASNLAGPPLPLTPVDPKRGEQGAVLGYPGGGPLVVGAAALAGQSYATGRNIYGTGLVERVIQTLAADVEQGNSGGPFVLADGSVGGLVFAKAVSSNEIGYSLPASTVRTELDRAKAKGLSTVGTGGCAE